MIFITGYHASGKSHLASMLRDQYGCLHVESSSVVRGMHSMFAPDEDLTEWSTGMEARYGINFFDEAIARAVFDDYEAALREGVNVQDVVITGNRSLEGVRYLMDRFRPGILNERPATIIAVRVSFDTLLRRYRERNRRDGDSMISEEAFRELTNSEHRRGLEDIIANADHILINESDIDMLHQESRELFESELHLTRADTTDVVDGWAAERRLSERRYE